jgi:hypothetical protein
MACQHHFINLQTYTDALCTVELQAEQFAGPIALWLPWITTFRTFLHSVKIEIG